MSLGNLYNKTVDTQRLGAVADTIKEVFETNLTGVSCAIHPVETEQQNLNDGAFYNTYKMWCAVDTDIVTGDRVIDGSTIYTVRGVATYDFGRSTHLRVTMVLGK